MQLRYKLKPSTNRSFISKSFIIKIILSALVFFLVIFFLDKIDFPAPIKLIKQEISHDKIITLK